jgi:hypothetical protein
MFEMRTNFYSTSIKSLFITRLHYSNLSNRIQQFVRFLRESNVQVEVSPAIVQLIAYN